MSVIPIDGDIPVKPLEWVGGSVRILDQRRLPRAQRYLTARSPADMAEAIRTLAVRGAPLLGIAAGYGMALAAHRSSARGPQGVLRDLERAGRLLKATRPTAANIAWAVDRVERSAHRAVGSATGPGSSRADDVRRAVLDEATRIAIEDRASCEAIGHLGAALIPHGANVLTHCNTGALATGGWGTAQGAIVAAHRAGKQIHVWVDETRPVLQGARLTAWELQRFGVPMTLISDGMAGTLMARGSVDAVVVGADRIAANGDVVNKVGTYQLAVLAAHHGRIPFYVAAPASTVDLETPTGGSVAIEERSPDEVTDPFGVHFAPEGTPALNPAFDVTPADLVTAIVTDGGVIRPPFAHSLRRLAGARGRRDRTAAIASEVPA
jgi:methylthioribose-1-phosphate isomerase